MKSAGTKHSATTADSTGARGMKQIGALTSIPSHHSWRLAMMPIILLACAASVYAQERKVGEHGNPSDFHIEGNQHFTTAAVRAGLAKNNLFHIAAHPEESLETMLSRVSKCVTLGYQKEGFPDIAVETRFSDGNKRVEIVITEGLSCKNGDINITGASEDLARAIRQRLEKGKQAIGHAPAPAAVDITVPGALDTIKPGIWQPGKPTNFASGNRPPNVMFELSELLLDAGWFNAAFKAEIVPDTAAGIAELHINLERLGPRAVISRVDVEGAEQNSREDILAYLGIKTGAPLKESDLRNWRKMLYDSGRFLASDVQMARPKADSADVTVMIDVFEAADVPLLREKLSRENEAFMKLSSWIWRALAARRHRCRAEGAERRTNSED
jgi:hypothetical protein